MDSSANHLLYILTDSNLPTGGFIASSGLESYVAHGFLRPATYSSTRSPNENATTPRNGKDAVGQWITRFGAAEMDNFASTTLPYANDAWSVCSALIDPSRFNPATDQSMKNALDTLNRLDEHHEAALLSHVARRASKAQGVAILTLYARSFAGHALSSKEDQSKASRKGTADELVSTYKTGIRAGRAPGHLAICWGILCAVLRLSREQTIHLHLYLHARSLLSAAVRLNQIGPYESTALLATQFKALTEGTTDKYRHAGTGLLDVPARQLRGQSSESTGKATPQDFWDWADAAETHGPATTWPLGEILVGRHDLQHTRLFNS